MIDYINRIGYDNREINLRETTQSKNMLNHRLRKDNISGYNSIFYHKASKGWEFKWYENKKLKQKYFKSKEEAIDFKLQHDQISGNMNGKTCLNL